MRPSFTSPNGSWKRCGTGQEAFGISGRSRLRFVHRLDGDDDVGDDQTDREGEDEKVGKHNQKVPPN